MGTSTVPQLLDALFERATDALPDITVLDGPGITSDPGDYLMIGVDDPNTPGFAATSNQVPGPMASTRPRDENGSVVCIAYAWNGDGEQKAARDSAYSYMAAVEGILRDDPNLGIATGGNFVAQMGDLQELSQAPNGSGVDALLIFNISFFARI